MEAVVYSNFRTNLKSYMKKVNEDANPMIVLNKNPEDNIVVMSQRDYDAMQETFSIMSNSYLMDKINKGDEQFQNQTFQSHELIEVESE